MTPDEFEEYVRDELRRTGRGLKSLKVEGKEEIPGSDGDYEIDASATFEAFGAEFKVVVECKRHSRPIARDFVLTLKGKVDALGAHKGMMFSTSGFQKGAIEYAQAHGIALFHVDNGSTSLLAKSEGSQLGGQREFCSWKISGVTSRSLLCPENKRLLAALFGSDT